MNNKITGRTDYKTCTGTLINNRRQTFALGQMVSVEHYSEAPEGGYLQGRRYAPIEMIAQGTEYGMHGTTALVQLTIEGVKQLIPARLLEVVK